LVDALNQYARGRAVGVAAAGHKVDDYYARELVMDALSDTWLGVVRWDPTMCSLAYHLRYTIKNRSKKHRKRAETSPHDVLDDDTAASRLAESQLVSDSDAAFTRVYVSEMMTEIRELAANDPYLLRILDAYAAGCNTKEDVRAHARMQDRTYHNAYCRLRRIVTHLSER
jgi:hypothetical protein